MSGTALPPFPSDVRTHPLLVIDYGLLKVGDSRELGRLWEAATSVGFWYLKNHGADQEVSDMFDMGANTMALPLEEKMTHSLFQSNIHRVVPPPGVQGEHERWSVVFFLRPGYSKTLRALVEDSPLIVDAVRKQPDRNFETGSTTTEWLVRRVKYFRLDNRKGPETWAETCRGTEHTPTVA